MDEEDKHDWLSHVPGDAPRLRVLIIGMNPSEASWSQEKPYAHRSNWMWRVLANAGLIVDGDENACSLSELASRRGVAFCDLSVHCENRADVARASIRRSGINVQEDVTTRASTALRAGPPLAVALVSKTVAEVFLNTKNESFGPIGSCSDIGAGGWWGSQCTFWILPSTSGLAGMRAEDRLAPFAALAEATRGWTPVP